MKNLNYLKMPALGLALGATMGTATAQQAEPNVIFILVDDLGYGDPSVNGQTKFETPNIDRMAENGLKFTQAYSGSTVSAPSRCALMTGKHTGNSFIRGNRGEKGTDGRGYDTALPAEEFTLGEMFQSVGYKTACVGKWGMGGIGSVGHPNVQGFDYFYGYLGQGHAHKYYPNFVHENSEEITLGGKVYTHDLYQEKAHSFISENKDNPFFLYLTYTIPHAEMHLPDEYLEPWIGTWEERPHYNKSGKGYRQQLNARASFAAMVTHLDKSVGALYELLEKEGIAENTLVIFTSDNGPHQEGGADPKFFNSSGVYRGIKRDLYEGGIRMPMFATYPGYIEAGTITDEMVAFWDMMPTFAELIGAEVPKEAGIDGLSVLPLLQGKKMKKKHDYLYWEFHERGGRQAVRQGDWKLIKQEAQTAEKSYYELYNIVNDPSETNNVIEQNAKIAKKMTKIMDNARTENKYWNF